MGCASARPSAWLGLTCYAGQGAGAAVDRRGKGGVLRQVLLPASISKSLLALRRDADDAIFASGKGGSKLTATTRACDIQRDSARPA
jgi:hypothetical protein